MGYDLWDFLASDRPDRDGPDVAADDVPACPYCGSGRLAGPVDNGRATRMTCDQCGGTAVATEGGQFMPDLIGQPDNHPSQMADMDSGGVGGAANHGIVHEVQQHTKEGALESTVSRVYHNQVGCRVCNRPEGLHMGALADPYPNPVTGDHQWFHGTSYDPRKTHHEDGYDPTHPGGKIVPPKHEPLHPDHVEASWNTDLGTHFSSLHTVANHGFAMPDIPNHSAARVAHTHLHMSNPKHFSDESEMNTHAINWALDNGHHYLPRKKSEQSKFRQGDYENMVHKDGTDYSYLRDHHSALPDGDRSAIRHIDNYGPKKVDEHPDIGPKLALKVKEQWLETHPKRAEISHGYQQHLKDEGHDGVIYGNNHEGPAKHTCAIAFHDTPVDIKKWEWTHSKGHDFVKHLPHVNDSHITPNENGASFFTSARVPWEFTATWADVRDKAKRITSEGGVRIEASAFDGITATVQGDSNLYETTLNYIPGTRKVGFWLCGCKWASYAWGRSAPFKRFNGRMCAHALALQFEALKQHAFGRGEVREHDHRPAWMRDKQVTVHHERGQDGRPGIDHRRDAALHEAAFEPADEPTDQVHPPAYAFAVHAALAQIEPMSVIGQLMDIGYDEMSAKSMIREALDETFLARSRRQFLAAHPLQEIADELGIGGADHHHSPDSHGHGGGFPGGGQHNSDEPPEPTPTNPRAKPGDPKGPLDPDNRPHRTEDGRQHAPEHGAGVPADKDDIGDCPQCHGQGCGHCGGGGQVDLDKLMGLIPDQNVDAGMYSRGQSGVPTFSSRKPTFAERAMAHFAEYTSYDSGNADPARRDRPPHSTQYNPASMGFATSADPAEWTQGGNGMSLDPVNGMRRTAADEDNDYRMSHRPTGPEDDVGAPLHDLSQVFPSDVYTHPHHYHPGGGDPEARKAMHDARGNPDHPVTIYRAQPKPHTTIRHGDWVTTSADYARQHSMSNSGEEHDMPVVKATVPAKHVWSPGDDLHEYGYFGPRIEHTENHFPGGSAHTGMRHTAAVPEGASFKFTPGEGVHSHHLELNHPEHGQLGYMKWSPKDGHVDMVQTHRDQRRQGIGTALYSKAEELSEGLGHPHPEGSVFHTPDGHGLQDHLSGGGRADVSHIPTETSAGEGEHDTDLAQHIIDHHGMGSSADVVHGMDPDKLHGWHETLRKYSPCGFGKSGAKKPTGPTVGGVALKAHDTGRVLMLQRSLSDEKDPARGTWEFPGGHYEPGDQTGLHGAIREWQEEVGQPFPEGGHVHHTWTSGPYQGHLVVIPEEGAVDLAAKRTVKNPDDDSEQRAWVHPDHARKYPDLRPEVKANTPWKKISDATIEKAALFGRNKEEHQDWQDRDNADPGHPVSDPARGRPVPRPTHPKDSIPTNCTACGSPDTVAYDNMRNQAYCGRCVQTKQSSDSPIRDYKTTGGGFGSRLHPIEGLMHTDPEPALPTTEGDDESSYTQGQTPGERVRSKMQPQIGEAQMGGVGGGTATGSVADIVAAFQATAGASALAAERAPGRPVATEGPEPGGGDIAEAARQHLAKTSMKDFSAAERRALIAEGEGGPRARNYGELQIEGTHYAELNDDEELHL